MEKSFSLNSPILDCKGRLLQVGRSFDGFPAFSRSDLSFFAREALFWSCDRYFFGNDDVKLCVEVSDSCLSGVVRVSLYTGSLAGTRVRSCLRVVPLSFGSFSMPDDPHYGDVILRLGSCSVDLLRSPGQRYVRCNINGFDDVRSLYINVALSDSRSDELYCAHELSGNGCRLARRKLGMRASGKVVCGAENYQLLPESSFGFHQWERGILGRLGPVCVLQADTMIDGEAMSFCFSSGICPDGFGGENIINLSGVSFDPGEVAISIDSRDFMRPWKMRSADRRCELSFSPCESSEQKLPFLQSRSRRIFASGHYSGSFRLSNGRTVSFDNIFGFGEYTPNASKAEAQQRNSI